MSKDSFSLNLVRLPFFQAILLIILLYPASSFYFSGKLFGFHIRVSENIHITLLVCLFFFLSFFVHSPIYIRVEIDRLT